MRKQLKALAITALFVAPFSPVAHGLVPFAQSFELDMLMEDGFLGIGETTSSATVLAEVVEIDGLRLIAEAESGERMEFFADTP